MRPISREAAQHFMAGEAYSLGETDVIIDDSPDIIRVKLRVSNRDVIRYVCDAHERSLYIRAGAYPTRLTADRINGVLQAMHRSGLLKQNACYVECDTGQLQLIEAVGRKMVTPLERRSWYRLSVPEWETRNGQPYAPKAAS